MSKEQSKNGYAVFIKPIYFLTDIVIINVWTLVLFDIIKVKSLFVLASVILWGLLSLYTNFYNVYRHTKLTQIAYFLIHQFLLFSLIIFASLSFLEKSLDSYFSVIKYLIYVFLTISIFKFLYFFLIRRYRVIFGRNQRRVVILGNNKKAEELKNFFKINKEYGFDHIKNFIIDQNDNQTLTTAIEFIKTNNVDEIYCSVAELSNSQIRSLIDYADNNLKTLKFVPDNKDVFQKKLSFQYYGYIPILSFRKIPLEDSVSKLTKRFFDIVFSSAVIVLILSWLTPIIGFFILLESKGPIFFKQSRNGYNNIEFKCYKFRSMTINKEANIYQATKGDTRITRIGSFIRKTSIDELPQFLNVFMGDMSVVGPRPHMLSHTNIYSKNVDKFMVRSFVKPGITGLAQIRGYRGEIETKKDIIGRVKYDIFYVENWSLLLDLRIILQTVINAVRGEEKAY